MGKKVINFEEFKKQYVVVLQRKLNNELSKNKKYLEENINPYKHGTVEWRISNVEEMIKKSSNLDNIAFGSLDFFTYSHHKDLLIIAVLTKEYKLYREIFSDNYGYKKYEKLIAEINRFGYNEFIFENNVLIDFLRSESKDKITYVSDGIEMDFFDSLKEYETEYNSMLPKSTSSYYTSKYTRSGKNSGYWNIGDVRVYD